jgi:predicted nucleic acid-binding protein
MPDVVIIDTDILIDSARKINEAILCLQEIEDRFPMAVSIVTQMELIIGCRNKNELESLDSFLSRFQIIKLENEISDKAIELLKHYRLSHGLLIADALIASTALILNQPLITKNQRDYQFVQNINLLSYPNPFV